MNDIKIYRFFAVNKKATLYVFNKVNEGNRKLDKLAKEYIKKYSDTNLFDIAAKREKKLYYMIFKDNKYVGDISLDILRYFKQLYINFIHIDTNYQRQGLSKILFNYVVNDVKDNFNKIKTIQGYPTSIEGKYFLESTGFLPDIYYCSSGSKGMYSIYYLNEKDTFLLDQKEYELVCGDTYNYRVNGVKKYNELVNAQKEIDPDFSIKNYQYFLKHNKVKKEIVKPIINSSIFTIDDCDLDDIMPISTPKEEEVIKEKVPSIFTQEYIDTYMQKME